jgi:hypothetical protein
MNKNISKKLAFGLLTSLACSLAYAQNGEVVGPVEFISSDQTRMSVLGQSFVVDAKTRISPVGVRPSQMPALEVGALVTVELESTTQLARATSVVVARSSYVPGATPVLIVGTVRYVSPSLAKLWVGGLEIDFSSVSPEVASAIRIGSLVEVYGIQPSPNGLVIGQTVSAAFPKINGKSNLGKQSIAGTGTQSIAGTGIQSIAGTGTQSIGGTGTQSIAGTGTQSIGGTGTQSIAGTGTQSIGGTGTQSIAGTGTQSIGGTGTQSIAGTGTRSIAGTGTQSIAGTGKQSIAGTGLF